MKFKNYPKFKSIFFAIGFMLFALSSTATIHFVRPQSAGSGDGSSWANASKDIAAMISASNSGDQIWIAAGTYTPAVTLSMKNGVAIYGGFTGYETLLSQRNVNANPTNISGNGIIQVFTNINLGNTAVLDGCTISNGFTNSNGGGIYNNSSSPTISNCTITSNLANAGGGIYNINSSSPIVRNCIFANNNAATGVGGAIANSSSSPTLISNTFSGNTAYYGGAIYNYSNASPVITNCNFVNNTATNFSAIYNYFNCSPIISNCTFTGNTAVNSNGTIANSNYCSTLITNSIIYGNAGGIYDFNSSPTISYSIVQGGYTGTGNLDTDPFFVNSSNPIGADGIWCTADDGLQLLAGSPAVNTGSNASVPVGMNTDITGAPRIQLDIVDMGAYELQPANSCTKTTVVYVDSSFGKDTNNGSSWKNAFKTLTVALIYAQGCNITDSILVAKGTYYPTVAQNGANRDQTFLISRGSIKIYGGYPASGGNRNIVANPTILSGNIGDAGITADNSYHVMVVAGLAATSDSVVVDGCTLMGGNGAGSTGSFTLNGVNVSRSLGGGCVAMGNNGNTKIAFKNCNFILNSAQAGGGLFNYSSSPTITNCAFSNNSTGSGGGIENYNIIEQLTISNCTFSNNTSNQGGGMNNTASSPILINCNFSNNTGSGMYNNGSSPTLNNTTFSNNMSYISGGGMYNLNSSPTLNNCSFIKNNGSSQGGGMFNSSNSSPILARCNFDNNNASLGGGMYNSQSSSPIITQCTFSNNAATTNGGGVFNTSNSINFLNSIFSNNTAVNGGAVYYNYGSSNINNCLFSANTANDGGGIYNNNGTLNFNNCNLINNAATGDGGAIENMNSNINILNCNISNNKSAGGAGILNNNGSLSLSNTTMSNNIASNLGGGIFTVSYNSVSINNSIIYGNSDGIYNYFALAPTVSYSNIQGGYTGTGNINVNPLFVDAANGNYLLSCGSPCINTGNNANVPAGTTTDLDGATRIQAGTVDMGAYEGAWPGKNSLASSNFSYYKELQSGTVSYGNCGGLITTLSSKGNNPVADSVSASVWIETSQSIGFVKRHYQITPDINANTATASVTLFFTQKDFNDFNAINSIKLPTGANDATGIANLLIEKHPGISSNGTGLPNTYTGTPVNINPADSNIVWNAAAGRWEVTFDVTGFSGFFVKTQTAVLPLQWLNLNATLNSNNQANINWQVQEINVTSYEIEKSSDGINFISIGTENSKGWGINKYEFSDPAILVDIAYYRIKEIDVDGKFSYSSIIKLNPNKASHTFIYPNPTKDLVTISGAKIGSKLMLTDMSGKILQHMVVMQNSFTIDLSNYASGVYVIKTEDEVRKILKE